MPGDSFPRRKHQELLPHREILPRLSKEIAPPRHYERTLNALQGGFGNDPGSPLGQRLRNELARINATGDRARNGMQRSGEVRGGVEKPLERRNDSRGKGSLEISEIAHRYCNEEECSEIIVTPESLKRIRDNYHEYRGQPRFVDDVLNWDRSSASVQLFSMRPELLDFFKAGGIHTLALHDLETSHSRLDDLVRDPRRMMTAPFGYTVWAVHPDQLKGTVFDPARRDNIVARPDLYVNPLGPGMMGQDRVEQLKVAPNRMERLPDIPLISETEARSGIPYLASVLDLKPEHLPWVEGMRDELLKHVKEVYGANENDVEMFFHKFIGEGTTTIHLQLRLRQDLHPMEREGGLPIDYVTKGLKEGKTGMDMVYEHTMERGGSVFTGYGLMAQMYKNKLGVKVLKVKNPYRI